MDRAFAQQLVQLNTAFYAQNAASFSSTRQAPWPGWQRVAKAALQTFAPGESRDTARRPSEPFRVFDLACGNLRFESFAMNALAELSPLEFYAADNNLDMAREALKQGSLSGLHEGTDHEPARHPKNQDASLVLMHLDPLLSPAISTHDARGDAFGNETPSMLATPGIQACQLSVCFGFMHHVPTTSERCRMLELLLAHTAPGGLVAVSFWNFMADSRMAAKVTEAEKHARTTPPFAGFDPAQLEAGDHLIGWQESGSYRYCHSFDSAEIDTLLGQAQSHTNSPAFTEIERFYADGKTGAMNIYSILERN